MTVAIGSVLVTAIALAVYPTVHRRWIRIHQVSHVKARIATWLIPDPAASERPATAPSVAGPAPQGSGESPDLLAPAARRFHFELTEREIAMHRRAS